MADLQIADVKRLAKLARIRLTQEEAAAFVDQLNAILDYVEQLKDVDVQGLAPTYQATGLSQVVRQDGPDFSDGLSTEQLLDQAPQSEGGSLKVPKIL